MPEDLDVIFVEDPDDIVNPPGTLGLGENRPPDRLLAAAPVVPIV